MRCISRNTQYFIFLKHRNRLGFLSNLLNFLHDLRVIPYNTREWRSERINSTERLKKKKRGKYVLLAKYLIFQSTTMQSVDDGLSEAIVETLKYIPFYAMDVTVIEELPTSGGYLRFRADQLYNVRKLYNLDNPERMKEAVILLREWLQKQDHINKKDFTDGYIERLLISTKGSVERAKSRLDKLCTFRTIWPKFFNSVDINSFKNDFKTFNSLVLPDVTEEYARVNLFKLNSNVPLEADLIMKYIQYSIILCEYVKKYDYPSGFIIMLDYQDVNLLDLVSILSPTQLQQMLTLYMEGYGLRIQGIHLITTSKMTDAFITLLKQVLSKKISNRIHVHRDIETIYEFVPKKILPADYGGDAAPISEIYSEFLKELSTKEHVAYMKETHDGTIDESKKSKDGSDDNYINMSGSFRTLSVD